MNNQAPSQWQKIAFNIQNVVAETAAGICIQLPHASEYDGFKFWISKKLLRRGRHSYEGLLSIKDDMTFKLVKNGNGKYNRYSVIAEKVINAEALADAFGGYITDTTPYKKRMDEDEEQIIRHTPKALDPVEIDADPELVR